MTQVTDRQLDEVVPIVGGAASSERANSHSKKVGQTVIAGRPRQESNL